VCIAKWFQRLLKKYPDIDSDYVLKALHGQDYHYFLDQQKDRLEEIFKELIIPTIEAGGAVPLLVIREILRLSHEHIPHDKTLNKKLNELASQNKIDIQCGRRYVSIEGHASTTRIQNAVIVKKGNVASCPVFDWSLVSSKAFKKPGKGEEYISEDNFVFGVKNIADDTDMFSDMDVVDEPDETEELIIDEDSPAMKVRKFLKGR
jgi:hypothetical protein